MSANLPSQEIESRLTIVRSRIRSVQLRRALLVIATVALGGLLAMMALDYFLAPLPVAARWAMWVAWIAGVAVAAKFGFAPLFKKIGLVQVARWIELRHPEMQERLSTVLELSQDEQNVSPGLLEALGRAAGEDIGSVDPQGEVNSAQTKRKWARPALALLAILVLALIVWPKQTSRLLVRAVAPFSDVGNAGANRFEIQPGNIELLEGDRLEIKIGYDGKEKSIDLWMQMDHKSQISQTLSKEGDVFSYVLDPVRKSFSYRAKAGKAESDLFTATIWPLPQIIDPRVTLDFPSYTGLIKSEQALGAGIQAVEATEVTLSGRLNTAVESAWLQVGGNRLAEGALQKSADGGRVEFSWKLASNNSGEAVVMLKHRLGKEIEALRFPIEVLPDKAPEVVLISPSQPELRVRPDEVLSLRYEVTEDFSLAKVAVEVNAGGDRSAMVEQILPTPVDKTKPLRFRGAAPVSVGELLSRFPGLNEMRLRVRAEDGRPIELAGPGVGNSEWLLIRIDNGAESLARQELRAEHDGARQTIEQALQLARQAKNQIEANRDNVKKEEIHENVLKDLEKSSERLAEAEDKLSTLAKQMEESIHAKKADAVEKAAEKLEEARENTENAALQDTPEAREAKLNAARDEANEAIESLEKVREAMERDRQKIEDLARFQELAQQQQELARQAQENLAKLPEDRKMPQDWQNRQRQMEERLKQQIRERLDAKALALDAQAEEAKTLSDEAKAIAEMQNKLEQQAQQIADPAAKEALKKSLQEALTKEQAKITEEAKTGLQDAQASRTKLADVLPKAKAAAEEALGQIEKGENQQAADSAKEAAAAMKEAADAGQAEVKRLEERAGIADPLGPEPAAKVEKLNRLATKQEQLAEAMDALAKGDLEKALKEFQANQSEVAAELTQDLAAMPVVEETGPFNEAKNAARQGSERAEQAAKKGQENQQQEAAKRHHESGEQFGKSAEALNRASEEFAKAAQEAASQSRQQQADSNKAKLPAAELAQAFQDAGKASENSNAAEAAQQAADAAEAMAQAAMASRAEMQGSETGSPQKSTQRDFVQKPGTPGMESEEGFQEASADPGVPPELAKLGISAADWEKIQATLNSDVGATGADAVPAEYRSLVKGYFESMSKKKE